MPTFGTSNSTGQESSDLCFKFNFFFPYTSFQSPFLYRYTRTPSFSSNLIKLVVEREREKENPTSKERKKKEKIQKTTHKIKPIINFLFSTLSSFSLYNILCQLRFGLSVLLSAVSSL
ncbi:hypothetical protein L6452_03806 [Arctium lappa]|uniref:Uncharacterized protein n=1 Tax=Arctium lappa TaxID=4217 RepID=A0ACB9FPG6_ARCLA|nr:hypothetical protein L6452_03806 [Arctium lappa]